MVDKPIRGVPILDVTGSGCTPDGRCIWLHFKLPEGNEHNFFLDLAHVDKTISMMRQAADQAHDLQGTPAIAPDHADPALAPTAVTSISVATSRLHAGVIVQATASGAMPTALLLPLEIARQLAAQLPGVVEAIAGNPPAGSKPKLH